MQKELYVDAKPKRNNIIIKHDDLSFDGRTITIPSYWAGSLDDYISKVDRNSIAEADRQDFDQFKSFLFDIIEYSNRGH